MRNIRKSAALGTMSTPASTAIGSRGRTSIFSASGLGSAGRSMLRVLAGLSAAVLALQALTGALAAPPPNAGTAAPPDYVLGPGDEVDITVYGQPDLTTTASIKPDGMIALPLINEVRAGGKTAAQLEAELTQRYAKYLKHPAISVAVRKFQMNHIYVMGEVAKPGRYDLTDNMTVMDAITLAGGATDMANLDATHIARNEGGKSKTIAVKVKQLIQGKDAGQNVALQNGDLVFVPRRGLTLADILRFIGILRGAAGY
jgi:polysaccharide export outer membrane protein